MPGTDLSPSTGRLFPAVTAKVVSQCLPTASSRSPVKAANDALGVP